MSEQAANNAIVSLAAVKSYLRIAEEDSAQDDFLQSWINTVSCAVEQQLRGPVVVRIVSDEIHHGDGTSRVLLDNNPVVGLQNGFPQDVMVRAKPDADWEILEYDPAFIRVDPAEPWYIRLDRTVFPAGMANLKVCYRAGYEEIPGQIIRVCIESVVELFKESNQGAARLGQHSRSIGGIGSSGATDTFYDLADRHRELLAPFVRLAP